MFAASSFLFTRPVISEGNDATGHDTDMNFRLNLGRLRKSW